MAAANSETWESNSHKFIDSLDRTKLGRFATDVEALRYLHKAEYNHMKLGGMRFQYMAKLGVYFDGDNARLFAALSELIYWWQIDGTDEMFRHARWLRFEVTEDVFSGVDRLKLIADNQDMHDYFSAGIWDVDFISKCVTAGLDADIALVLYNSEKGNSSVLPLSKAA